MYFILLIHKLEQFSTAKHTLNKYTLYTSILHVLKLSNFWVFFFFTCKRRKRYFSRHTISVTTLHTDTQQGVNDWIFFAESSQPFFPVTIRPMQPRFGKSEESYPTILAMSAVHEILLGNLKVDEQTSHSVLFPLSTNVFLLAFFHRGRHFEMKMSWWERKSGLNSFILF